MGKPLLLVEFSGGRTSAFMRRAMQLHPKYADYEIVTAFMNTGRELEPTLRFVQRCDSEWGWGTVWLEADVQPAEGEGTRHKVVSFETAARKGEPLEAVFKKFGLPSLKFSHCTREAKQRPVEHYMRQFNRPYKIALGIRGDERDRESLDPKFVYPLIDTIPIDKAGVIKWWAEQSFDLDLPTYLGNCDFCFKKSRRKRLTIAKQRPELTEWWADMERRHGEEFRERFDMRPDGLTVEEIQFAARNTDFREATDDATEILSDPQLDMGFGCFCRNTA